MAREAVRDLDALAEEFTASGVLPFRLRSTFIPVMGVNHKQRREFGL